MLSFIKDNFVLATVIHSEKQEIKPEKETENVKRQNALKPNVKRNASDEETKNIATRIPETTRRVVFVKEFPFKSTGSHLLSQLVPK